MWLLVAAKLAIVASTSLGGLIAIHLDCLFVAGAFFWDNIVAIAISLLSLRLPPHCRSAVAEPMHDDIARSEARDSPSTLADAVPGKAPGVDGAEVGEGMPIKSDSRSRLSWQSITFANKAGPRILENKLPCTSPISPRTKTGRTQIAQRRRMITQKPISLLGQRGM